MRAWGLTSLIVILALPAITLGQSLAEAARKERDRRDKLTTAGHHSRVITDEELKATKGRLANDPGASEPEATARTEDGKMGASRPAVASLPDSSEAERQRKEQHWRSRAAAARRRLALAEQRYQDLDRMIRIGQPPMYDENGRRYIHSRERMKALADEAEANLAEARKALEDLEDQARRAGALPGWLR
jgi:hypothetical protein